MTSTATLQTLLGDWRKLLTDWAASGQLTAAAREALQLKAEPELLKRLAGQWSKGDFSGLPPIVLLPSSSMPGAAGAYAISTKTIYLNRDWLKTASHDWVMSVLTEELGHHLDGLLNPADTPGDEGEVFSDLLTGLSKTKASPSIKQDSGYIVDNQGKASEAEYSSTFSRQWIHLTKTKSNDAYKEISTTLDGGFYATGYTCGDLGGNANKGGSDSFVAKYSHTGAQEWAQLLGSSSTDESAAALASTEDGSVYVATNTFNGSNKEGDKYDIFVDKLDTDGGKKWRKQLFSGSVATDMSAGKNGEVFISLNDYSSAEGYFWSVAKFKTDGGLISTPSGYRYWASMPGYATAMASDDAGSFYVTGSIYSNFAGKTEQGLPDSHGQTFNGRSDTFLIKYTSNGSIAWARILGTSDFDGANDIVLGPDGHIYIVGYTYGSLEGANKGAGDMYLAKYKPDGTKVWLKQLGSSGNETATSVSVSGEGIIYVCGNTTGSISTVDNSGNVDALLVSYDADGDLLSSGQFGGIGNDMPYTIALTKDIAYIAGETTGAIDGQSNGATVNGFIASYDLGAKPEITLSLASKQVTEDGTTNLVYTFTRTTPTTSALTVNYTIGGTATNGTDYATIPTSVTFAAGASTATVTVDPKADTTVEGNETVVLTLATGTGYTIGTSATATGTITNDDVALPSITLAVSPSSVTEDGTTNLVYTFTRTTPTTSALTVNYTIGGTATNGTDYATIPTSVTFAAGASTATVTVDPKADTTVEGNETVVLTLATGTGYTIGTSATATGTITNDDTQSSVSRTLVGIESSLTLTGTKRISGTGNSLSNIINGNSSNNRLRGADGKDTLTGGGTADSDIFAYNSLSESLLGGFDVITDYSNRDRIQVPLAVLDESEVLLGSKGTATGLNGTAIGNVLTSSAFAVNAVAAFTVSGQTGTFIAINDGRAGFQADTDSIIQLQNYTISSTNCVDFI